MIPTTDLDRLLDEAAGLRALARRLARDDAEADDLAQETLARAIERPPRPGSSWRAWLATVLRNRVRETRRRERSAAGRVEELARDPHDSRTPAELATDAEERALLQRALAQALLDLSAEDRTAVTLAWIDDVPGPELARRIGLSHDALRQRLARARRLLRARLDRDFRERAAWCAIALAPREPVASPPPPIASALVMSTSTKIALAAAAALVLSAFAGLLVRSDDGSLDAESAVAPAVRAGASHELGAVTPITPSDRATVERPLERVSSGSSAHAVDRERDLHGLVVDASGAPIAGASLRAERGASSGWNDQDLVESARSRVVARTVSAADGGFAMPLERGRPYTLVVEADGFAPARLGRRDAGERVVVVLGSPCAIAIEVVRADGSAQRRGNVLARRVLDGDSESDWELARADLDDLGRARLANLPPGAVEIVVEPDDGGWPAREDVDLLPGADAALRIALPAGDRVEGVVRDARTHEPIAGARIGSAWTGPGTTSDASGAFVVEAMPDTTAWLHVTAAGHARTSHLVARDAEDRPISPVAIELEPGLALRGRVVDERGAPVADAYVASVGQAWVARFLKSEWKSTHSGDDGAFELRDLDPALPRIVHARKDGLGASVFDVVVSGREVDVGDVVLLRGAVVTGRVVDADGRAVPDLDVGLESLPADRALLAPGVEPPGEMHAAARKGRTDDLGRFAFADVARGEARIATISSDTWSARGTTTLLIDAGARVDAVELIVDRALAIGGTVRGADGAPLAGAGVQVAPTSGNGRSFSMRSGSDGRFALVGVASGEHDLVAQPPAGSGSGPVAMRVAAGVLDLEVRLPVEARLEGTAVDASGKPVASAWIVATDGAIPRVLASATSDAQGRFAFGLAAGVPVVLEDYGLKDARGKQLRGKLAGVLPASGIRLTLDAPR